MFDRLCKHFQSCCKCSLRITGSRAKDPCVSAAQGGVWSAYRTHSPQGSVDIDSPVLSEEVIMAEDLAKRRYQDDSFIFSKNV